MYEDQIKSAIETNQTITLQPSGTGTYDFSYDATTAHKIADGSKWLLSKDGWCGNSIEGQCYRAHVRVISRSLLEAILEAIFDGNLEFAEAMIEDHDSRRLSNSPAWMRSVARKRGASFDPFAE